MGMAKITLNGGFQMPVVGLGVWQIANYRSEAEVGEALSEAFRTGLVEREELFITTKATIWNSDHGHVLEACKDSLKKLQLDYLDRYLVHFPIASKHAGVGTKWVCFRQGRDAGHRHHYFLRNHMARRGRCRSCSPGCSCSDGDFAAWSWKDEGTLLRKDIFIGVQSSIQGNLMVDWKDLVWLMLKDRMMDVGLVISGLFWLLNFK
ncbi:hypothetical protein SLEP1_g31065 [Rubroshorea leprosula]|uniref:NADP-dependent oxidoreductase domain-containing protein n=1 Tax=Rubroshorea leprosula TaxID=152421 RepID=A0AAV5K7S2_9ROSI|nr:hypothetical protein SLEP1_g31065 [Rubroshorea leprosula]